METGNLKVRSKEIRKGMESVILLEPIDKERIEDYHYDIRLLSKDFDIEEIEEDFHFVRADQVSEFFKRHTDSRYQDLTQSLRFLNEEMIIS